MNLASIQRGQLILLARHPAPAVERWVREQQEHPATPREERQVVASTARLLKGQRCRATTRSEPRVPRIPRSIKRSRVFAKDAEVVTAVEKTHSQPRNGKCVKASYEINGPDAEWRVGTPKASTKRRKSPEAA
jgi:hypothetical protein